MGVLDGGLTEIISLIANGQSGTEISGINIGTDDTAFSSDQTGLMNELDRQSGLTASQNSDTMTLTNTFENNTGTVQEAGMYTDDSDDTQVTRQVVDDINLESSDSLEVTFELQAQNA